MAGDDGIRFQEHPIHASNTVDRALSRTVFESCRSVSEKEDNGPIYEDECQKVQEGDFKHKQVGHPPTRTFWSITC